MVLPYMVTWIPLIYPQSMLVYIPAPWILEGPIRRGVRSGFMMIRMWHVTTKIAITGADKLRLVVPRSYVCWFGFIPLLVEIYIYIYIYLSLSLSI